RFDEAAGGIARDHVDLPGRERAIHKIEFHDTRWRRKAELVRLEKRGVPIRTLGELITEPWSPLGFHSMQVVDCREPERIGVFMTDEHRKRIVEPKRREHAET